MVKNASVNYQLASCLREFRRDWLRVVKGQSNDIPFHLSQAGKGRFAKWCTQRKLSTEKALDALNIRREGRKRIVKEEQSGNAVFAILQVLGKEWFLRSVESCVLAFFSLTKPYWRTNSRIGVARLYHFGRWSTIIGGCTFSRTTVICSIEFAGQHQSFSA